MTWRELIARANRACGDSDTVIAETLKSTDMECPGFLDQEVKWKPGFDPDESIKVMIERTKKIRQIMKDDPRVRAEVLGFIDFELAKHSQKN